MARDRARDLQLGTPLIVAIGAHIGRGRGSLQARAINMMMTGSWLNLPMQLG